MISRACGNPGNGPGVYICNIAILITFTSKNLFAESLLERMIM